MYCSPIAFHLILLHISGSAYYHSIKLSFSQRIPFQAAEKDLQKIEFSPSGMI